MAELKWVDVDMADRKFTLTITKNGKPLTLPMSDYTYDIFKARETLRENDFVFPGPGKSKHLIDARFQAATVTKEVAKKFHNINDEEFDRRLREKDKTLTKGIRFTFHDIRRTFASCVSGTVADGYELKRLLNHAVGSNDVTGGYVIHNMQKLRRIVQEATDYILNLCGYEKPKQEEST